MKKIGVFSDSHDNEKNIRKVAEIFANEKVDAVVHCGDMVSPFIFRWLEPIKEKNIPGYAVFGNNDGELQFLIKALKPYLTITGYLNTIIVGGIKIAITHGHLEELLNTLITSGVYDVVLTGHTHKIVNEMRGNTLVVNPGETCGYLTGTGTYAIIEFEENKPPKVDNVKILNL
jgi:putative phosphoesterase